MPLSKITYEFHEKEQKKAQRKFFAACNKNDLEQLRTGLLESKYAGGFGYYITSEDVSVALEKIKKKKKKEDFSKTIKLLTQFSIQKQFLESCINEDMVTAQGILHDPNTSKYIHIEQFVTAERELHYTVGYKNIENNAFCQYMKQVIEQHIKDFKTSIINKDLEHLYVHLPNYIKCNSDRSYREYGNKFLNNLMILAGEEQNIEAIDYLVHSKDLIVHASIDADKNALFNNSCKNNRKKTIHYLLNHQTPSAHSRAIYSGNPLYDCHPDIKEYFHIHKNYCETCDHIFSKINTELNSTVLKESQMQEIKDMLLDLTKHENYLEFLTESKSLLEKVYTRCCEKNHVELIQYLLENSELLIPLDFYKDTCAGLQTACLFGSLNTTKYFMQKENVTGENLENAIMNAVRSRNIELIDFLSHYEVSGFRLPEILFDVACETGSFNTLEYVTSQDNAYGKNFNLYHVYDIQKSLTRIIKSPEKSIEDCLELVLVKLPTIYKRPDYYSSDFHKINYNDMVMLALQEDKISALDFFFNNATIKKQIDLKIKGEDIVKTLCESNNLTMIEKFICEYGLTPTPETDHYIEKIKSLKEFKSPFKSEQEKIQTWYNNVVYVERLFHVKDLDNKLSYNNNSGNNKKIKL